MKKIILTLICTLSIVNLCACNEKETEIPVEETANPITIETDDSEIAMEDEVEEGEVETFDFLDVHGNSYTATILQDIPMHNYDYSRLDTSSDLYTYSNEDGTVTSTIGIDVSKYQGEIDWKQVKEYGIDFVIIRLGYRGYSEEGNLAVDEYYETNIQGALDAGLEVGVYFFSQAITNEEALEEAEFVLDYIENYDITMPVVFDTEVIEIETARTYEIESQIFTDACIVFCDRIEEAGYDSMIYFNMVWSAFTLDLEQLTGYDKWYADYYDAPQYPYAFQMWQYTESATVPGIEGNVDLNIIFE